MPTTVHWRDAKTAIAEAERLYRLSGGIDPHQAGASVRSLVRSAGLQFAREERWEQLFRLLSSVPLPAGGNDALNADLVWLRHAAHVRESRRAMRIRRRLLVIFLTVLVYLFGVAPTLFIRLENPTRIAHAMTELDWSEGLYWSVLTFTTVGYGDIVPETPYARLLALLNAVLGVTMMGVVAGLVLGSITPRRL